MRPFDSVHGLEPFRHTQDKKAESDFLYPESIICALHEITYLAESQIQRYGMTGLIS